MSNRERTIESKGRIEFIDLAKGICILLVVMIHVGVPEYIPGLYAAKVPIFFLLSGLFFLKKVNFFLRGGVLELVVYNNCHSFPCLLFD